MNRVLVWVVLILNLVTLGSVPVWADVSTAALGIGGIQLKSSSHIRMDYERLTIGWTEIEAVYQFKNISNKPIETVVAFPLPEYKTDTAGRLVDKINFMSLDEKNPVGFQVWVNGKPVHTQVDKKSRPDADDPQLQVVSHYFYWTQRFPPHQTIEIRHVYQPAFGAGSCTLDPGRPMQCYPEDAVEKHYCISPTMRSRVSQMKAPLPVYVEYVLKTGAHWKGPIARLDLIIKKERPQHVLGGCLPGLKKIDPVTFKATYYQFEPKRDLKLIWFQPLDHYLETLDKSSKAVP